MASLPLRGPILVIAPHPDDESLGCGGLIAAAALRGERVHTVFVTDGGASHPGSSAWSRARLAACRAEEAREALRRLGVASSETSFLGLADADMPPRDSPAYEAARESMIAILQDLSPALVVLPWRRDPHRDHRDSWSLAMDCLGASQQSPEILEYAIWLDELGAEGDHPRDGEMERVGFDISEHREAKRHAVRAHRSQLGELVPDDPSAFVLKAHTIDRLTGPEEVYWRPCARG